MSTEPHRLQSALSMALTQQPAATHDAAPIIPDVRYPVGNGGTNAATIEGQAPASRPLFAASVGMAAAALAVAFNAPTVLLASVAGIAVCAAVPLLNRKHASQPKTRQTKPKASPKQEPAPQAARSELGMDRDWELSEISSQFINLFDKLGDMIVTCSLDGRIMRANHTFCMATGHDNPEGLTLEMIGIDPVATDEDGVLELVLEQDQKQTIWQWSETIARDPISAHLVIHCIGRNVTAARKAETELVEARERAEAASHSKTRFLATVSHEMRTPLNGILGMHHLLGQTETTPEQASYLKTAQESGHALLSLIEDLLDVTSIEAGRLNLRSEEGNLEELVHGVCELMASRAHEKGIEIAVHIGADAPEKVTLDLGRLRQVLFNLVGNAIKFTETGGVLVEVGLQNQALAFSVTDTGPGLKEADQAKIFDEFERADNGPTRKYGGAGLGLSISSRIVEALGGEIGVTSTLGKGSTFRFTIPLVDHTQGSSIIPHRGPLSDRAVLVIAPRGPVATAMLWTIRDLGGDAEAADDIEGIVGALTRFNRAGLLVSDIIVDRRMAEQAEKLLASAPTELPVSVTRTLVIAPEDSRNLEGHGAHGADAWLVRPVRRTSLINVLTRRDDREDRNRLANKNRHSMLERGSDAPTLDILLAEDDPVNALLVRKILANQGHRVTLVENGRQLVEEATTRPGGVLNYDVAITDLSMPELDGKSAIIQIRQQEETNGFTYLPIIVLSADGQASTRDEILAAGADGHAEKPVDPEWLLSLVAVTARKPGRVAA